jgi:hypothetical protein
LQHEKCISLYLLGAKVIPSIVPQLMASCREFDRLWQLVSRDGKMARIAALSVYLNLVFRCPSQNSRAR